jgi:hypothetical protein
MYSILSQGLMASWALEKHWDGNMTSRYDVIRKHRKMENESEQKEGKGKWGGRQVDGEEGLFGQCLKHRLEST